MSNVIDQKVVEMRFDNKQFEQNVSTTMSSVDKLKKSLNFKDTSKELESFAYTAGFSLQDIKNKMWSLLEYDIAGKIKNKIMSVAKELTVAPIASGFNEYELKMGSIQTIMASTGESLETVNGYLGDLNEYSDKTIYSFQDMTSNIGKFTNAGVNLEDSVAAIKGVSNVAAVSGANANEASRAMYNFAQALSAGYVKLIDWKSIENANMATVEFKNQLLEAAVAEGKLTKTSDGMYKTLKGTTISATKNFNDSLQEQWMTSEVLIGTLKKYSDETTEIGKKATQAATEVKTLSQLYDTLKESAQSGWAQTWEIVVGDFEEAKAFLAELNDLIGGLIGASADARNQLLENWKVLGGREELIEAFRALVEVITSVVKPIKEAWQEVFSPLTSEGLYSFTVGLKEFVQSLILTDETADKLKRIFKGLFSLISIGIEIFKGLFSALGLVGESASGFGGGLLEVIAIVADAITAVADFIKESKLIKNIFLNIGSVVKIAFTILGKAVTFIADAITNIVDAAKSMKDGVTDSFDSMGLAVEGSSFFKILSSVWNAIKSIASGISKALGMLMSAFSNTMSTSNLGNIFDIIQAIISGGIGISLIRFIKSLKDGVDSFSGIAESFGGIFEGITGCLEGMQTKLKADALMKIAGAVAILSASLVILAMVDSDKLSSAIAAITMLFIELMGAMAVFTKLTATGGIISTIKSIAMMKTMSTSMIKIAAAILILALALRSIATLKTEELIKGLVGIAGLMALMIATVKILGKNTKEVIKGATQMVIFAAAIKILASVCKDLSVLSWEELAKGLVGVGVLLAEVSLFMNTAKFSGKSIKTAAGIVILSAAIKILASACHDFAYMSWEELGKGLAAIGGLLVEIALFTNLTGKAKHVVSTGVALIAIAAAMKIFASAAQDMAYMSWEELGRGLAGMAGALAAVVIALNLMPKNMVGKGLGLIAVSTALLIMSTVISKMGGMSWEEIAKGLVSLGGAMLILALGLNAMKGTLGASASLLVAAVSLSVLASVMKSFGKMSWGGIIKGLVGMAGAIAVLGVAALVLQPILLPMLALAGIMLAFGVGLLAAGIGLTAIGAGLSALAIGLTAIVGSLGAVVTGIVNLIAAVMEGIGRGIIAFCEVIADGAPAIAEALKSVIISACKVLIECAPLIAKTLLQLLLEGLKLLTDFAPQIVDSLFQFLVGIINSLAKNIPDLTEAIVNVFFSLITSVVNSLAGMDMSGLLDAFKSVGLLAGILASLAAMAILAPFAMAGVVSMGIVIAELTAVLMALGALAQIPGIEWLINEGGDFLQTIGTAIGKFIGGIAGGIAEGISSSLPAIGTDLSNFMSNVSPFIEGAKQIDQSALDGVKTLIGIILAITAANIIESLTSWLTGGNSVAQFATDITLLGVGLKAFSDSVSGVNVESVKAATEAAKTLAEMTAAIPNEGGVISWFTGENSISKFASQLPALGNGLKGFSDSVTGIVPENIISAANAAKTLAEMTTHIPNQGGIVAWITGENSISKFASSLVDLGRGIKGFSDEVVGINPEYIIAASNAAKALAQMTSLIPSEGGIKAWFAGETSVSKFAGDLVSLGRGIKGFSDETQGVSPETVTAAANAAKNLAAMIAVIPSEGGIKAWFAGESSVSKFAGEIPKLGKGLAGFSEAVAEINAENITAGANAAKSIAEMTSFIPKEGGIKAWFSGDQSVSTFASKLPGLGKGIAGFAKEVADINPENVKAGATAAKTLAQMAETAPKDTKKIISFGDNLKSFGTKLKEYFNNTKDITSESISTASKALDEVKEIANVNAGNIKAVANAIKELTKAIKQMATDIKDDLKKAGKEAIEAFIDGIDGKLTDAKTACSDVLDACADSIGAEKTEFETAGKNLVNGFVNGIDLKKYTAAEAARAMAAAAAEAAKDELREHSPSRVGVEIGDYFGIGFVNGIAENVDKAYGASKDMAKSARNGLSDAISKVSDAINSDIDTQPTIRPVLDLSNIRSGAGLINGMFGNSAIGINANAGVLSSVMSRQNRNGTTDDVISAINSLRKDLNNMETASYTIGNVNFSGDAEVEEAFNTIIRAVNMARRT